MKQVLFTVMILAGISTSANACKVIEDFQDKSSATNWGYLGFNIDTNKLKKEICRVHSSLSSIRIIKMDGMTSKVTAIGDGCTFNIFLANKSSIRDNYKKNCKSRSVKKIINNSDGSKAVICSNGSHGTITFPKSSICVIGNGKDDCKVSNIWSVTQAAKYLCK